MTWPPKARRTALAALLLAGALLLLPAAAAAKPPTTGGAPVHPGARGTTTPTPATPSSTATPSTTGASTTGAPSASPSSGGSGQSNDPSASNPDNTQALGGGDPLCKNPAVLDAQGQRNCIDSGTPETPFPLGNYALDQHIDTGVTGLGNLVPGALQSVVSLIFGLIARIVAAALLLVSLAFSFSLYGSDHGQIPQRLASVEHFFTGPLLIVGMLAAGVWMAYQIAAQRRLGRAVGGLGTLSLMLLGTLFLMQNPHGTIDRFEQLTNSVAEFAVGAFSGHPSSAHPTGSYANATEGLWTTMGEEPWCAMEFGEVGWCMSPIDKAMRQKLPALERELRQHHNNDGNGNTEPDAVQQQELCLLGAGTGCRTQPARPTDPGTGVPALTNGELFLAFPTNDDARNGKNDKWTLYHTLLAERPELAQIRGPGGAYNRLFALVMAAVGMFFFLLLLAYIAINLLIASMLFVILLLFAGIMAIVACFGDWGRQKWLEWAGMTVGALAVKILYSVYLGVLIGAFELMGAIGRLMGDAWLDQWILFCVFWILAFAFRRKLMNLFAPTAAQHEHHPGGIAAVALPALALARAGARTGTAVSRAGARAGGYGWERYRDSREERRWLAERSASEVSHRAQIETQRTRGESADRQLNDRARQMLDARYRAATAKVEAGAKDEQQAAALRQRGRELRNERLSGGMLAAGAAQTSPAARARDAHLLAEEQHASARAEQLRSSLDADTELHEARRFVSRVQENERRTGRLYGNADMIDARAAVEQEIRSRPDRRTDHDYQHLAYRLGENGREQWKDAKKPEREALRGQIDAQIAQDRELDRHVREMPRRLDPPRPLEPPRPKRRQPHRYRQYGEFLGLNRHQR